MNRKELLKNAKPILFNTEMVQAILDDRKTVTRRKIDKDITNSCDIDVDGTLLNYHTSDGEMIDPLYLCRYQVGDILYVRETFKRHIDGYTGIHFSGYIYKADYKTVFNDSYNPWKSSIHMPKEAARIFLKVTDVKVERLQDITSEQSKNEGVDLNSGTPFPKSIARDCHGAKEGLSTYQSKFVILWNSTVKKQDLDRYGWEANPFVWVIEFERVEVEDE